MRAYLDTLDATELGALMALDLDGASKLPGEQAYKLTDRGFEKLQEYLNRRSYAARPRCALRASRGRRQASSRASQQNAPSRARNAAA